MGFISLIYSLLAFVVILIIAELVGILEEIYGE